jgi:phenylacetate-coenzyme A ligase PaaK-like adenylate-forming protein
VDTFKSFIPQLYPVNDRAFTDIALKLFQFQAENNPIYKTFIQFLDIKVNKIHSLNEIPFLPISFFKSHDLKTGNWQPETIFRSSGTNGQTTSTHAVPDLNFYHGHALKCFEEQFGSTKNCHFLALLPSYLERNDSSLVSMMQYFIQESHSEYSGFYLNDIERLLQDIKKLKTGTKKVILWGVTFALLDLAENHSPDLSHCIVFETGGMKGRREEITRMELHSILKSHFNVDRIYSEYGMTELMSQAYTRGNLLFYPSKSMKIIGRDLSDPLDKGVFVQTAGLNVVDLANIHSVSFIETEDIGKVNRDGSFEVLGRMDNSDIRGCNLLIA